MRKRRSFLIAGALVLLIWAPARPALAAPITFITALPVPEGEGIFRLQLKYLRSTDDPDPSDRELGVLAVPLVVAYGVTQRLALFGIVPVVDKSLDVTTPLGRRTRSVSGVADTTLLARYTLFQRDRPGQTTRFAPFVGVEAATGDDDESDDLGRLPQPLQLGSGSWDFSVGATATWQTLSREVDASFSYKLNGEANDFELGDEARLDLSYQHRVWPRELGDGVPSFLYGVLESNLIWQDRHAASGSEDPNSGGTTWFLAPGIQYVSKRLVIEAAVQIPVVQDLKGAALANDFITTLSARVNF